MRNLRIIFLFFAVVCGYCYAERQAVIPQPAEYIAEEGFFTVPQKWNVNTSLPELSAERLLGVLNSQFKLVKKAKQANLLLKIDTAILEEGYRIAVTPKNITITAKSEKGFFYGLQSLNQLLKRDGKEIACCTINDYPRFEYRSIMLDPTRYFIPKDEVLRIIDVASALKFNNMHLHLADDNGWRLEIKKYPKLTEVGAWRVARDEIFPGRKNPVSADEPTPVGGFYTQEDMREIVEYASRKHINVVPEIEMPAHSAAAIASYPELACPIVDKFVGVFPGIGGEDASIIMCGGNDKTFEFYYDVLDEVMDIFPSPYIHLGGDEANKSIWEKCPLCNQRIKDENLKNCEELQGYFMDRVNKYVRSHGRTAMGWDEVTYGDPKEDMVILGWQGTGNVAIKYAKNSGRKFILTPAKTLYLIRYQGPQWFEPFTYFGNNTLNDVYLYEPYQKDWSPSLKNQLLGIQGSLWTEFCNSPADVEYLLFPRLIALADAAWRPEGSADWDGFIEALDGYLPELEERGINYARSMYNIQHKIMPEGDGVSVALTCERPDVDIKYSIGTNDLQVYTDPLKISSPVKIVATTFKGDKPIGQPLELNLNFNKATGCKVTSFNCNNELQGILTNGLRGSNRQSDFEWAGWHNKDAEFIVDLGEIQKINTCRFGTLGFSHVCVVMPESVELYGSEDGETYNLIASASTPEELIYAKEPTKRDVDFGDINTEARFIKVIARNPGKIPEGYARFGTPTWMYFDEIMIE